MSQNLQTNHINSAEWIPALTGVRGAAILMVLIGHLFIFHQDIPAYWQVVHFGALGVDFFFILSGYLITQVLVKAKKNSRHFFLYFYARRALRIFPIYFLTLALIFFAAPLMPTTIYSQLLKIHVLNKIWFYTFLANWFSFFNTAPAVYVGHFWSIFVEEQFYILWPVFVRFFKLENLIYFIFAIILMSTALRFSLLSNVADIKLKYQVYCSTLTRIDALAFGAIVFVLLTAPKSKNFLRKHLQSILYKTTVVLLLFASILSWDEQSPLYFLSFTFSSLFFSLCIIKIILDPSSKISQILNHKYILRLGTISYGLYIIHWPIFCFFNGDIINYPGFYFLQTLVGGRFILALLGLTISLIFATISWRCLEKPILSLKERLA